MLEQLQALPDVLGQPVTRVADTGYYSEANVTACGLHAITPLIAMGREKHHPDPMERFTEPAPLAEGARPWRRCATHSRPKQVEASTPGAKARLNR